MPVMFELGSLAATQQAAGMCRKLVERFLVRIISSELRRVGRALAKPTNSSAAMGFVTSSDMRPIWSLCPSYK